MRLEKELGWHIIMNRLLYNYFFEYFRSIFLRGEINAKSIELKEY